MTDVTELLPDDESDAPRRSELVQSLSRGLAVIRAFGHHAPSMTLTDVANRTGLSRAVARRFLLTLVADGYASTNGKYFRLTPKVLDLGFAFLTSLDIWAVAQPIMAEVVQKTHESCSASVLDGTEIVYVARVAAGRIMQVGLSVGSRLPAFCSSMGRVLLAGLPAPRLDEFFRIVKLESYTEHTVTDEARLRQIVARTREQGYALVDEELEIGLRSLAVPIHARSGEVLAAMNVSMHASRGTPEQIMACCLPVLRDGASRISTAIPV
jgi:IclR family pca regulon transcriptional regulator